MDGVVPRETLGAAVGRLLYRAAPLDTLLFRKEVRSGPNHRAGSLRIQR